MNTLENTSPQSLPEILGYTIVEQLYLGSRTAVYRAVKTTQQRPVVIKVLRREYPSFGELLSFRNQYTIAKNLNIPGIVTPLSLEPLGNTYALVMEDWGGVSLGNYIQQQGLNLTEVLAIAQQLADILHDLAQNRVIHKDIKPANILIHPATKQIKLIDFSIASLLPKETQEIQSPNVLEGTLAYIAPEQTGRMNRGIDYRADFYALGVTLYQLLSGNLPFTSHEPLELVHCHIAKIPIPVNQMNPEIPAIVGAIVTKLMAKNAEDRYQSAKGLQHDLEQCLTQWKATGEIKAFELGMRDLCDRFTIPEKLYGRETEVQLLLAAFNRVANGASELMLVAGFSGIGKTVVVNEVHKPITSQNGYFVKGKFDQFNRNIPLSAFVQALRDLMAQLLCESDNQLKKWKDQILEAVGENGQVLIEVIPELEQIIGQQPIAPELSGSATQNRFNLLFQRFIEIITTAEHPLVLFLDDLQWADLASLQLVKLLMNGSQNNSGYLLMLGAYRDNEVSPVHPFVLTVEEMKKAGAIAHTITLAPLAFEDTNHLIADTLNCAAELAQPLTELINRKTQGNPFFTTQFLKALHEDGFIQFTPPYQGGATGGWECDITQINALAITDDVVEFMAVQLQKLSDETQQMLKLAACVGNQFDLNTLAIVSEKSPTDTATALWKALQEGLILPTSQVYKFFQDADRTDTQSDANPNYRFLHDRVQQAAYSLIPQNQQKHIHFKIGKRLQARYADNLEDVLFEIVNHLNLGVDFIEIDSEREELAHLNLRALEKAMTATAYKAAVIYFQQGIDLLKDNCWESQHTMTLKFHKLTAQAHYISGEYGLMNTIAGIVLTHAVSLLDRISIYEIQIQAYISQNQQQLALNLGLEVLKLLQIELIQERPQHTENIESLIESPVLQDPKIIAALRILTNIITPAWTLNPQYFKETILTMVSLSLEFGMCPNSAFGFAWYATWLCESEGDIDSGYQFGKLAMKLVDRFASRSLRSSVCVLFATHVCHWKESVHQCLPVHIQGLESGLETGNLEYACYAAAEYAQYLFLTGKPLTEVEPECRQKLQIIKVLKQDFHIQYLAPWHQGILNLQSYKLENIEQLIGDSYDETMFLEEIVKENKLTLGFSIFFVKMFLAYLFGRYEKAVNFGELACRYTAGVFGTYFVPTTLFYHSLSLLVRNQENHSELDRDDLAQVDRTLKKLKNWANFAPMNYQHKYTLLKAELNRVQGCQRDAIELYDLAIAGAKTNGYIQEEALANELAAKFYLDWGKEKVAAAYMQEAYYGYAQWGAKAKTNDLEQRYGQLLGAILQPTHPRIPSELTILPTETRSISNSHNPNIWLDFPAAMAAAQAISEEIELEKLLATLMRIAIANAGAQSGHLVLHQDNQWVTIYQADGESSQLLEIPLDRYSNLPQSLIYAVARTQETAVFENLSTETQFAGDRYLLTHTPKSVLCMPMSRQGKLIGILYLENQITVGAFTRDRIEILKLLTSQAAISLENARLYQQTENYSHTLEAEVKRQTEALKQKAQALEETLEQLQQTQAHLIHSEKMLSLGQLVAGVSHEINNPINFIHGNISHTKNYVNNLIDLLKLYQSEYPKASSIIQAKNEEIEIDFVIEDVTKILESMEVGSERIRQIVLSLRNFARLDESTFKKVDLQMGLESTLLLLKNRLQATENQPAIRVVEEYDRLPQITCYPSQLNQVFLNLINNAIDAIRDNPQRGDSPEIRIRTAAIDSQQIRIVVSNTDSTIPESIQARIFDPFFTTKPVGSGTGLGLFVSYSIIEKHGGRLTVRSHPGEGTEFAIILPIECKLI
ncbi:MULTISPECIES: trifunctional serine/threonine-protein kinase/ATP-binding protein/sensor histidine kinase [unclassified Microcoleus]|uniref:trifunctional serine/threonine-protein kinase/ATP-binding protein/sensor histidine kinase n=1 Tax=unclassified Microcoleus TaxID=2642155 RepID=UPI002FCFBDEF